MTALRRTAANNVRTCPKSCVEKTADQTLVALTKGIGCRLLGGNQDSPGRERCTSWLAISHVEAFKDRLDVLFLVDVDRPNRTISSDAKTKESLNGAQVRHLVLLLQSTLELRNLASIIPKEE